MKNPHDVMDRTGSTTREWLAVFDRQRGFAEHAFSMLDDEGFFQRPAIVEGTRVNSVAIIVQHMAGNMRSRWTDFLTSDGEKPWRRREEEFSEPTPGAAGRQRLMERWAEGWSLVHAAIEPLQPADLARHVRIRGQAHTVESAVVRQVDHYGYHVGQIVLIARLLVPEARWTSWFTIAPGESDRFNRSMGWTTDIAP